jgi:hypothetical protein
MKHKLLTSAKVATVLGMMAAVALLAQDLVRYDAQPRGSTVRIDGTSTVHDWTVEGQLIGGFIELEPGYLTDPGVKPPPEATSQTIKPNLEVTIPVRSLRSGRRQMDQVMQDAMNMKEHARIDYRIEEMTLKEIPAGTGAPLKFDTKGKLTVSGVTRPVEMEVLMERLPEKRIKFTGETQFKMTDFGITPPAPSLALGLIRTGDEVTIAFEWLTAPRR